MLKNYSKNQFYFVDLDVPNEIVNTLIYFKIISFVSFRSPSEGKGKFGRGYLIDLSTTLTYQHIKKSEIKKSKYLKFRDAKEISHDISPQQLIQIEKMLVKGLEEDVILDILGLSKSILNRATLTNKIEKINLRDLISEKRNYNRFKKNYNSESMVEVDKLAKRDKEIEQKIQTWATIRYISINLAKELVSLNIEYNKSIRNNRFEWNLEKKEEIKSLISKQFRGTFTRAYNTLNEN